MNRETFEQLVSAWLDEPHRDDLRRRIDAALDAEPELGSVYEEWRRFDTWLWSHTPRPTGVDWQARRAEIAAATARVAGEDAALDRLLAALPGVEHRVDWTRLRGRIMAAATRGRPDAGRRGRRLRRVAALVAASGVAAAAVVWALRPIELPPAGGPASADGTVRVAVHAPARERPAEPEGTVFVRIAGDERRDAVPERFFIVDPIVSAGLPADFPDVY